MSFMDGALEVLLRDHMAAQTARRAHVRSLGRYRTEKGVRSEVMHTAPTAAFDDVAFDAALRVFHRVYLAAYRPGLPSEEAEAHGEATRDALEAAIGRYRELTA